VNTPQVSVMLRRLAVVRAWDSLTPTFRKASTQNASN